MSFFRNPEIRKNMLLYLVLTIAAVCAGFAVGTSYGILAVCLCLLFDTAHFISTYWRYRKISGLSREIDRILHGQESINLAEYSEGELAILEDEIYKMTVRMREQADILKKDKTYLSDSIADISHQIRTPLTSINLIVSFLSEPGLDNARRIELTQKLKTLLSRIDWLIVSLLKISKLDAGTANFQSEIVSVAILIKKAAESLAIPMELRDQQLTINVNGDAAYVGDLSWSIEAVGNILKNCMESTPTGGKVEITASENTLFTEIIIRDNGSGIDKADLPHLFERFYKGKTSSEQSVGIGLALTRMIVNAQNGSIKVENNKEGGARFTIRFYKVAV